MWDRVVLTIQAEFMNSSDIEDITRTLLRLFLAGLLGGVVGYERQHHGKNAGLRTHMLVAMGSALFVLVPQLGGMQIEDMSRVIQGVIAGIGFLGAGAIIKSRSRNDVKGLTTAASIWTTSAIGIACGLGRETTAVISTLLALLVLGVLPLIVKDERNARR